VFSSESAGGIELEHRYVAVGICVFGLWKEHYQILDRVDINDSALYLPRFWSVNHAQFVAQDSCRPGSPFRLYVLPALKMIILDFNQASVCGQSSLVNTFVHIYYLIVISVPCVHDIIGRLTY